MVTQKRLFLLAGYDRDGIIDDALVHYAKNLSNLGDVVLFMDCDCNTTEISKIQPYCKYVGATRHGEYDFGSYKRAYIWARDNKILDKYNTAYLVNDSVYGPMFGMADTMERIDSVPTDAAGLVVSTHKTHSYMESWFIRLNKNIFTTDWFDDFMLSITQQPTKNRVSVKYEHGLSKLVNEHGLSWGGAYVRHGRYTYNNPKKLFKQGCPFIKKACFKRHNGASGGDIRYILRHSDKIIADKILNSANRVYGTDYMNWLLTNNMIKILARKLSYAIKKIKNGRI